METIRQVGDCFSPSMNYIRGFWSGFIFNPIFTLLILGASTMAACGPKNFEELPRPYFLGNYSFGPCSSNIAIDANRNIWSEHGCEAGSSGLQQRSAVSASGYVWLTIAFNILPLPPPKVQDCPPGTVEPPIPGSVRLVRATAAGSDIWSVCTPDGAAAPPYDSLVSFFQPSPTDTEF
jgi:hypothetical protein